MAQLKPVSDYSFSWPVGQNKLPVISESLQVKFQSGSL